MCNCIYISLVRWGVGVMNQNIKNKDYFSIDIKHVLSMLLKKIWLIIICCVIGATGAFCYSAFIIPPKYSADILLYVNNSSLSVGGTSFSISSSEITAAQSLVKTYIAILKNRTTLDAVIEKSGVNYTSQELYKMISAESVNETEVFKVKVTSNDPYDSAKIANCIAKVLPMRISEIIEGSSMKVVDSAVVNRNKVSPSITKYTGLGGLVGALFAAMVVIVMAVVDDTIHDEEYILQNYDYPILAKVPDLYSNDSKGYSYYKRSNSSNNW